MRPTKPSFLFLFILLASVLAFTQSTVAQSDPTAAALAVKSYLAMTGGHSVEDATMTGLSTWIAGSDHFQGQVTLKVKRMGESKIELSLDGLQRTEIRGSQNGGPAGVWVGSDGQVHPMALHNCWSEAAWFFPPLLSVFSGSDSTLSISYVGSEMRNGIPVEHLRISHTLKLNSTRAAALIQRLSTADLYLDTGSSLPIALDFSTHPDEDANREILVEVRFSDYRSINGVQVPFRVQKFISNGLLLDVTVQTATINSGLSDADFSLQ